VVQFHNELPPQWNVHIVAIGARFFYDDGTDVQVGPTPVDIAGPNGMVPLSSPDPAKYLALCERSNQVMNHVIYQK
jgi:hypothetical protein